MQAASALEAEAPVNELVDTIFGCYPSSKAAGVVPKGVPTIWHKRTARHLAHALETLQLSTHWSVWHHSSCWVRHS
jgi:hypothetical protein